jgi:hypothetical protein
MMGDGKAMKPDNQSMVLTSARPRPWPGYWPFDVVKLDHGPPRENSPEHSGRRPLPRLPAVHDSTAGRYSFAFVAWLAAATPFGFYAPDDCLGHSDQDQYQSSLRTRLSQRRGSRPPVDSRLQSRKLRTSRHLACTNNAAHHRIPASADSQLHLRPAFLRCPNSCVDARRLRAADSAPARRCYCSNVNCVGARVTTLHAASCCCVRPFPVCKPQDSPMSMIRRQFGSPLVLTAAKLRLPAVAVWRTVCSPIQPKNIV